VLVNPLAAAREIATSWRRRRRRGVHERRARRQAPARRAARPPRRGADGARVEVGGDARDVDLSAHAGDALDLVGDTATPAATRRRAVVYTSAMAGGRSARCSRTAT
jgi:hypothetical protein